MGLLLELLAYLVFEIVGQIVGEFVWAALRWAASAVGVPDPLIGERALRRAVWSALAGGAAAAISFAVHPAPVGQAAWMRGVGLLVLPPVAGATLAVVARLRRAGPTADAAARVAFWAGFAFGAGYAGLRLGVPWVVRAMLG